MLHLLGVVARLFWPGSLNFHGAKSDKTHRKHNMYQHGMILQVKPPPRGWNSVLCLSCRVSARQLPQKFWYHSSPKRVGWCGDEGPEQPQVESTQPPSIHIVAVLACNMVYVYIYIQICIYIYISTWIFLAGC